MDEGAKRTEETLKELEKRIAEVYREASESAAKKADDYFRRFEKKDAEKKKQVNAGTLTEKEYKEWRANQMLVGDRWNELRENLAEDYVNADKIAMKMVGEGAKDVYAHNFNYGTYDVERQSKVNTAFTLYDRSTVERLIKEKPALLPPYANPKVDIPKDRRWNQQVITSAVTQAVLTGQPIPELAKNIFTEIRSKADSTGMTKQQERALERKCRQAAIRSARTAMTSAQNAGRMDSYRRASDKGIVLKKVWQASLDNVTRDSHVDVDGEEREIDEEFSNGLDYPGGMGPPEEVYNCRCTLISKVDEEATWEKLKKMLDEMDG